MKEYILSIVCVSVVCSLVSMLTPEGDGGGLGRYTRLVCGLCLIIVSLSPIKNGIEYLNNFSFEQFIDRFNYNELEDGEYGEIFYEAYGAAELENLKNGIKQILHDKFSVDYSECRVSVTLKPLESDFDGQRELERIFITLYGSSAWKDTNAIENYLHSLFNCEIITAVEF